MTSSPFGLIAYATGLQGQHARECARLTAHLWRDSTAHRRAVHARAVPGGVPDRAALQVASQPPRSPHCDRPIASPRFVLPGSVRAELPPAVHGVSSRDTKEAHRCEPHQLRSARAHCDGRHCTGALPASTYSSAFNCNPFRLSERTSLHISIRS